MRKFSSHKKLSLKLFRKKPSKGLESNLFAADLFENEIVDKFKEIRQGYVRDPELSKLLTTINMPDTILAERLDCAYSIYIRCKELSKERRFKNPIDKAYLKDLKRTYFKYVNDVLGGNKSKNEVHELMAERMHIRMSNYEYIPGKSTNYTAILPSQERTVVETHQYVQNVLRESSLSSLIEEYQTSGNASADVREDILFDIVNNINIKHLQKKS